MAVIAVGIALVLAGLAFVGGMAYELKKRWDAVKNGEGQDSHIFVSWSFRGPPVYIESHDK